MKFLLATILLSQTAFASVLLKPYSTEDFASLGFNFSAPVVSTVSDVSDKQVGMIIFDSSANRFKGYDGAGAWRNLNSTERIERAYITNNGSTCNISSQSGSWLSGASRTSTGNCTLSITSATFTAAPNCSVTAVENNTTRSCQLSQEASVVAPTSSAVYVTCGDATDSDMSFQILCMGSY